MAKSLIGKADSTLVNMALKEGLSNVPADMTKPYDAMATTYGLTNKFLLDQANEMFSDINSANEEMLNVVNPIYEQLQDGTFADADMMQFKGVLDTFRDEWKSIPKGKDGETQRMQWKSKVNKFNNGIKALDQDLNTITTMIANDQYVVGGADGVGGNTAAENMKFLTSIYNTKAGNEGNKATMSVDNGEIFFTANIDGKEIKMSQPDIKKLIPVTDHDALSARDTILNNLKTVGKTKGTSYNDKTIKDTADSLYRTITYSNNSRDTFQTLAHTAYGEESFYQALHNPFSSLTDTIKKGLLNISLPDKFDVAGGKGVDEADFENIENFNQIKKYIMNNPRVGGRLLADWTAATDGTNAFSIGTGLRPKNDTLSDKQVNPFNIHGYFTIPGSGGEKRRGEEANNLRTQIQNIVENKIKNKTFTGYYGDYVYQTEGDNAGYFTQGEDKKSVYTVLTEEGLYYSAGEFEKSLGNLGDGGKGGGEGEINNAYNMTGDIVESGLAAGIFMQDDNAAATTLQALLPVGFVIKKGGKTNINPMSKEGFSIGGTVGKFFGVDKLTIVAPDGTNLGTYDFGYSDSDKALEESKRFNSNVVESDYFRKNNIVLGNL